MELSLPYVAGLFDGEGSVGIYRGREGRWNFRVQMIQNESPDALTLWMALCDHWGGHVSHARAEQADVALAWLDSRPPMRRDPLTGRKLPRSAEDVAATQAAADQLKRLKRQDIGQVMADAADPVEIRHTLRQIVNVKSE